MLPILLDEGLPPAAAIALRAMGLDAYAIDDPAAPPKQSPDDVNIAWCKARGALLVTNDRGRKERIIRTLLVQERVHALFVYNDLRSAPVHVLVRCLLVAEGAIDDQAARRRGLISHRLTATGRIRPLG